MADILELVMKRMPIEMANEITSFLGQSKSAEIMDNFIRRQNKLLRKVGKLNPDQSFVGKWQLVRHFFGYISTRKHLDIGELIGLADMECQECIAKMNCFETYLGYGGKCYWCHLEELGHDVYTCDGCEWRTERYDEFENTPNGLYCQNCIDESLEDEDESEDEEEFWE